jgi:hypothetical protein
MVSMAATYSTGVITGVIPLVILIAATSTMTYTSMIATGGSPLAPLLGVSIRTLSDVAIVAGALLFADPFDEVS